MWVNTFPILMKFCDKNESLTDFEKKFCFQMIENSFCFNGGSEFALFSYAACWFSFQQYADNYVFHTDITELC